MTKLKKILNSDAPAWLLFLRRLWLSPAFFAALLLLGFTFTTLSLEVAGALTFLLIILIILITSDDAFSALVPFLLLTVLVSACYDGYALFIPYWPLAFPAVLVLLFHFTVYRGTYCIGTSFAPLVAVSVAVTLGGVGCLSFSEYFKPATLFYVVGLGFGMVGIYLLLKSTLSRKRDYDVRNLLLTALYLAGIYAAFFTFLFYAERFVWMKDDLEIFGHLRLISIDNRNVYATFLLLALPAPFYHAVKGKGLHLACALLFLAALLMSGSRGGLLMGVALFGLCFLYLLLRDKPHRTRNLILLALLALGALAAGGFLIKFYSFRFEGGFIKGDEPRVQLLKRAIDDFLYHPLFGVGLGYTGNADIYDPKTFAMNWYHMMIPQIVAGLGLVGTLAYAFLFWRRGVLARRCKDALSRALFLAYVGLFLMSQVNPGEFCPLPYEMIAVMIFLFLEDPVERETKAKREESEKAFEGLLAGALFDAPLAVKASTDWNAVLDLADEHAVFGVLSEALTRMPEDALPKEALLSLQDKTVTLLLQNAALAEHRKALIDYLHHEHIPAVILKGDSVARFYPVPDLRVAGDIDCLLPESAIPPVGKHLKTLGFSTCEGESTHHVTYRKGNVVIELHRTVSGLPKGPIGQTLATHLESIFNEAHTATVGDDTIPVACDFHEALILILHTQQHLREGGLGMRQLSDFALFLRHGLQKEGAKRLLPVLAEVGLLHFASVLAEAAVRHLGLPREANPFPPCDAALAEALAADILAAGNFGRGSKEFSGSAIVTLHREGKGGFKTALHNVCEKCRAEWPSAQKHPALLIYLVPFWVIRRMLRSPVHPFSMLRSADKRGKLYDQLALFQTNAKGDPYESHR